jgi:AraC family transcriptional regulator, transcriptional activator of pobA
MPKSFPKLDFEPEIQIELPFEIKRLENMNASFKNPLPHRTDFYVIFYFSSGAGTHYIDFQEYPILPNTLFFLSPSNIHSMLAEGDTRGYCIVFTEDFLNLNSLEVQILHTLPFFRLEGQKPYLQLSENDLAGLKSLILKLEEEYNANLPNMPGMLKAYFYIFLVSAGRIVTQANLVALTLGNELTRRFLSLVETHFRQKKRVSEYARLLGITPGYLSEIVKQTSGKTAITIIQERVVLEAKRLLYFTDEAVAQIAQSLNYEDPSYFIRLFQKVSGQTPLNFRKTSRKKYHFNQ